MGRKRTENSQFTVTLPKVYIEWLDKKVTSRIYYSRNHGIEICIRERMKDEGLIKDE